MSQKFNKKDVLKAAKDANATVIVDLDNNFYETFSGNLKPITPTLKNKRSWSNVKVYEVTSRAILMSKRDKNFSPVALSIADPGDIIIMFPEGDHKIIKPAQQKYITD